MKFRRGVINRIVLDEAFPKRLRWRTLRALGIDCDHVNIYPGCWFGGTDISIGAESTMNTGVFLDNLAPIRIGEQCAIGIGVMILTSSHDIGPATRREGTKHRAPVIIGDGCWLGSRAVVMPGVTIGPGCVIAAGAVVTKDCAPNGLYAGVPARRIRDLDAEG
jgi:maltose O-acetyltransferase